MSSWDRQSATTLSEVDNGHLRRYEFALGLVSGRVLDCACGPGYGTYILSSVADATGIDISTEALEHANKYFPGPKYLQGDAREVKGEYDWIVSIETIEHISEPERAVKAFREAGKNLIVSTPNQINRPWYPWDHFLSDYPHLRHFTPDEFDDLLTDAGWDIYGRYRQAGKKNKVTRGTDGDVLVYVCG